MEQVDYFGAHVTVEVSGRLVGQKNLHDRLCVRVMPSRGREYTVLSKFTRGLFLKNDLCTAAMSDASVNIFIFMF